MPAREQMIGEAQAFTVLEDALRSSAADQTEIVLEVAQTGVTRYANNEIHQNVTATDTRVAVRAVVGRASARAFANSLAPADLRAAVESATAAARLQTQNPRFVGLPSPVAPSPDVPLPQTVFFFFNDKTTAE